MCVYIYIYIYIQYVCVGCVCVRTQCMVHSVTLPSNMFCLLYNVRHIHPALWYFVSRGVMRCEHCEVISLDSLNE